MTPDERTEILNLLDRERQHVKYPGVNRFRDRGVAWDVSLEGGWGEVVYCSSSEEEIDQLIARRIQAARAEGYELEWKLYGHDQPDCLGERLVAAGFEAGEAEAFMVLLADDQALDRFGVCTSDIRLVTGHEALRDVQLICEEVHGESCQKQIEEYGFMLENHPEYMSLYAAYVDGEPAACGRVYFHPDSQFAGLYGGQTRKRFRKRGLFTQLVGVRVREALSRGIVNICVDALPTSEPIFSKLGFEKVTYTQPYSRSPLLP